MPDSPVMPSRKYPAVAVQPFQTAPDFQTVAQSPRRVDAAEVQTAAGNVTQIAEVGLNDHAASIGHLRSGVERKSNRATARKIGLRRATQRHPCAQSHAVGRQFEGQFIFGGVSHKFSPFL